jgi:uncharacterized membrane protein YgdD (TMEM256/DUF423 family)
MSKIQPIAFLYLALAIGLGALGAHGIKPKVSPETLDIYKTGVLYHIVVAMVLLMKGEMLKKRENSLLFIGSIFFSFSLYAITLLKMSEIAIPIALGLITPIGGLFIISSLIMVGIRLFQNK